MIKFIQNLAKFMSKKPSSVYRVSVSMNLIDVTSMQATIVHKEQGANCDPQNILFARSKLTHIILTYDLVKGHRYKKLKLPSF